MDLPACRGRHRVPLPAALETVTTPLLQVVAEPEPQPRASRRCTRWARHRDRAPAHRLTPAGVLWRRTPADRPGSVLFRKPLPRRVARRARSQRVVRATDHTAGAAAHTLGWRRGAARSLFSSVLLTAAVA